SAGAAAAGRGAEMGRLPRTRLALDGEALGAHAGANAVTLELEPELVHPRIRGRAELERLAGHRLRGHTLVGLEAVGVTEALRAVADHPPASPSSHASVTNIACDQRSGVATGPQRATHSS